MQMFGISGWIGEIFSPLKIREEMTSQRRPPVSLLSLALKMVHFAWEPPQPRPPACHSHTFFSLQ